MAEYTIGHHRHLAFIYLLDFIFWAGTRKKERRWLLLKKPELLVVLAVEEKPHKMSTTWLTFCRFFAVPGDVPRFATAFLWEHQTNSHLTSANDHKMAPEAPRWRLSRFRFFRFFRFTSTGDFSWKPSPNTSRLRCFPPLPPSSPPKYLLKPNTSPEVYLDSCGLPGDVSINLIVLSQLPLLGHLPWPSSSRFTHQTSGSSAWQVEGKTRAYIYIFKKKRHLNQLTLQMHHFCVILEVEPPCSWRAKLMKNLEGGWASSWGYNSLSQSCTIDLTWTCASRATFNRVYNLFASKIIEIWKCKYNQLECNIKAVSLV